MAALALLIPLSTAFPIIHPRGPIAALPPSATAEELRWQPSMDFDQDGCYNVAAVDASGSIVPGLPHNWVDLASECRDAADLSAAENNVYVRRRCNAGWCVYLYDYYFEKDVAVPNFIDPGHTHDWEHIAVWVRDGAGAEFVAVSQHGEYEIRAAAELRWDGEHPKVVYHKDGVSTHAFRFAFEDDDAIENHTGAWYRGPLVNYDGFPGGVRDVLFAHDFGQANIAIKDSSFPGNIANSRPDGVEFDENADS
ncbi:necrosis inducing protein [Stachybotrys elegans]|uniref:Necrosis inducing protein n=1 Tax=Stachybotrys elegans TaxID=80388 RepID=A0A8K0SUG4_9HYPO|nr:necrosis inducing protein [Stachybotrys elegans]